MKKSESDDSINRLPDEIVFQIVNKIIDLKTLCFCKLVSKHFYSIVHQVDTISFTAPLSVDNDECKTLKFAIESLRNKFTLLKSLRIDCPSSCSSDAVVVDDPFLFKVKFCTRINSFLFISSQSVSDNNDNSINEEYDLKLYCKKLGVAMTSFRDVSMRFRMLHLCTVYFPLLEKVSITDSVKNKTVSLDSAHNGGKISEVNKCSLPIPHRVRYCYLPFLKLRVSGYVMAEVILLLWGCEDLPDGKDNFINVYDLEGDEDFDDKEEALYKEALTEIFNNHRDEIQTAE